MEMSLVWGYVMGLGLCLKERNYILNPFKNPTAVFYNFIKWSRTTEETRAKGWRASM